MNDLQVSLPEVSWEQERDRISEYSCRQAQKVCMSDGSLEALPRRMASLEDTLQQTPGIPVWLQGKPAFLISAAPNPSGHQHIPTCTVSSGTGGAPTGPREHIHGMSWAGLG